MSEIDDIGKVIARLRLVRDPLAEKHAANDLRERQCELHQQLATARSSIPEVLRWATFDAPELTQRVRVRNAIRRLSEIEFQGVITIIGAAGLGKSSLAAAALRRVIDAATVDAADDVVRRARLARFVRCPELGEAAAHRGFGSPEPRIVRAARHATVLVLDDLGVENTSEASAALVREVIHARHARRAPLLVTSGFTLEELTTRYGSGIARRLREEAVFDLGRGTKHGLQVVR